MTDTDIAPQLEVLIRRRIDTVAQLDAIKEALASIDAAILTLVPTGTALEVDEEVVFRTQTKRTFNEDKAREVLPAELVEAITVTEPRIDSKKAREVLPPALYEACLREGSTYVTKAGSR